MDFLNKAFQQISELFQQMTPTARITAGLLLVAIVCSLFYLFRSQASLADEYLFGGDVFSHRDLATMQMAFSVKGAVGSQIEGNRIKVPRGKKEIFLKALREQNALPENYVPSFTEKAIDEDNPFKATQSRSIAMKTAKERELSRNVRNMKGIEDANVMYDETMTGSFPRRMERRASVSVKAMGNRHLTDDEVKAIRNIVIGSVGSLTTADVTVLDLNANRAYAGADGGLSDNPYAIAKAKFENDYRDKIAQRLSMYPGIVVAVNVELDPDMSHSTQSVEMKGRPVEVQSTTFEKSTPVVLNTSGGGRPGASPNGVGGVGNSAQAVTNQITSQEPATETRSEKRLVTSQQQIHSQKAPLVPNRVTASIDVPSSYFTKVWKERNPVDKGAKDDKKPDVAELKKIEDETKQNIEMAVANILPPGPSDIKLVNVTSFTELAEPPASGPSFVSTSTKWLESNWQTLAMIAVAMGSLLFLRGMLNSVPPEPAPATQPAEALKVAKGNEDAEHSTSDSAETKKRTFRKTGPDLRAELTDLVKEDPDTAANILKVWIGEAA